MFRLKVKGMQENSLDIRCTLITDDNCAAQRKVDRKEVSFSPRSGDPNSSVAPAPFQPARTPSKRKNDIPPLPNRNSSTRKAVNPEL